MSIIDITFLCGWIGGSIGMALIRFFEQKKIVGPIVAMVMIGCLYAMILLILKGVLNG